MAVERDVGVTEAVERPGEPDLDSWSTEMKAVWQAAITQFVRVLAAGLALFFVIAGIAGLVNHTRADAPLREQYAVSLKAADDIAIAVGILVLVATVNIAIAVMDLPLEPRERMRVIAWQRLMSLIAQAAAVVGFAMGAAMWLSNSADRSWPSATATTALGLLSAALASAGSWRPKDAALLAMERRTLDRRYELVRARLDGLVTASKSSDLPEARLGWTTLTLGSLISTAMVQSLILTTVVAVAAELGHNVDSAPGIVYGVILLLFCMLVMGNVIAVLMWSAWLYRSRPGLVFAAVIVTCWTALWLVFASSARTANLTERVVDLILSIGIVALPFATVILDRVVPNRLFGAARLLVIGALAITKTGLDQARHDGKVG